MAELISSQGKSLSQLVGERMSAYPCSGSIYYTISDATAVTQAVRDHYAEQDPTVNTTGGIYLGFMEWRKNPYSSSVDLN